MSEDTNPTRVSIYLTSDEYADLYDNFSETPLVDPGADTYANNHPFGEYLRRRLENPTTVDMSDYEPTPPSSREYSRNITVLFPQSQYENLRSEFSQTPLAEDKNARGTYGGNSAFGEYLRRYLRRSIELC